MLAIAVAGVAVAQDLQPGSFDLDPQRTVIAFHLAGRFHEVYGTFQLRSGTITVDPATGVAGGTVVVDAASGDSENAMRDARMTGAVLEADRFPDMTFRPVRLDGRPEPDGSFHTTLHGILTLHGGDHEVAVDVTGHLIGDRLQIHGHFVVPYVAWGLPDPSMLVLTVAKEVEVDVTTSGHVVWTTKEHRE
jgi:polyisoprenoid-binding protein YceI